MFNDKFILLGDTVKDLGISCEQLGIQYTSKLSTLEVTVSQQSIQIKSLEKQLKEMDTFAQEGWDLAETYTLEIKALKLEVMNLKTEPSNTNTTHTFRVLETRFYAQDYTFIVEAETEDEAIDLVANGYITEDSSGSLYGVHDSEYNEVSQLD